ncbi:hypothetical protein CVT25_006894 [Psilocybe cyanescens]|uniref:Uncharacterized protein n=1 Tax=Psilocybe cyanescens TaxID=93625 RepID=A0A409X679_PSICY|nr:hypothetical protein CVT25_006894 [Psilocybe cyanescens]
MLASMSLRSVALCMLLASYVLNAIASPLDPSATDELVHTPGGMLLKSNVHTVPEGGKVVHSATEVRLLDADGAVLHVAPLKGAKPRFNLPNDPAIKPSLTSRNLQAATIAAIAQAPSVSGFQSNWALPPLPQVNSGQLLMYFAALAPPTVDALIQPTLQYGVSAAGGGPFWSLASWFITEDQAFVTNLTQLSPGSLTLDSFVVNEDEFLGSPGVHAWFTGFSSFPAAGLNVQTAEDFNVAIVALEITNAITLGNLPNTPTDIDEIFILETNGDSFSPIPWSLSNDTADGITINRLPRPFNGDETLFFQY